MEIGKMRFAWDQAWSVAEEVLWDIAGGCARIEIAGSLRRRKPEVGDIEIVYVSLTEQRSEPGTLFGTREAHLANERIDDLIGRGILEKRPNAKGSFVYGTWNKLLRHVGTGIPVDLFATTQRNWWNYLVCRTGPADLNKRIATRALQKGWSWHPYDCGFRRGDELHLVGSEQAVFEFVDLPFLPPEERR